MQGLEIRLSHSEIIKIAEYIIQNNLLGILNLDENAFNTGKKDCFEAFKAKTVRSRQNSEALQFKPEPSVYETPMIEAPIVEISEMEAPGTEISEVKSAVSKAPIRKKYVKKGADQEQSAVEEPIVETSEMEAPGTDISNQVSKAPTRQSSFKEAPESETEPFVVEEPIIETPEIEEPVNAISNQVSKAPTRQSSVREVEPSVIEEPVIDEQIVESPEIEAPTTEISKVKNAASKPRRHSVKKSETVKEPAIKRNDCGQVIINNKAVVEKKKFDQKKKASTSKIPSVAKSRSRRSSMKSTRPSRNLLGGERPEKLIDVKDLTDQTESQLAKSSRKLSYAPNEDFSEATDGNLGEAPNEDFSEATDGNFGGASDGNVSESPTGHLSKAPTRHTSKVPSGHLSKTPTRHMSKAPTGHLSKTPVGHSSRTLTANEPADIADKLSILQSLIERMGELAIRELNIRFVISP